MNEPELVIEGFATWLLIGQLALAQLSSGVQGALTLLNQSSPNRVDAKIVEIKRSDLPAAVQRIVKPNAEGFHFEGDDKVYINKESDVYKAAQNGDKEAKIKMASIIAHEAWHVQNGPDENGAYGAQLAALERMKAPGNLKSGIALARKAVTGR